jgi:acetyltransferase
MRPPCDPPSRTVVADLPQVPDLAVIATPAASVPGLVAELGARGCRAAVVISAGFEGADRAPLRQAMLDAARPHLLRVVGPNCLGVISPALGVNASFAHLTPAAGGLALVSQSGAIAAAALDWAHSRGLGFSQIVTVGDALDVDVGDLLDYLAQDDATKAILVYIESLSDARKFMSAGRIAAAGQAGGGHEGGPQRRGRQGGLFPSPARWPGPTPSMTPRSGVQACSASASCGSSSRPPRRWAPASTSPATGWRS